LGRLPSEGDVFSQYCSPYFNNFGREMPISGRDYLTKDNDFDVNKNTSDLLKVHRRQTLHPRKPTSELPQAPIEIVDNAQVTIDDDVSATKEPEQQPQQQPMTILIAEESKKSTQPLKESKNTNVAPPTPNSSANETVNNFFQGKIVYLEGFHPKYHHNLITGRWLGIKYCQKNVIILKFI
jgi:hypothetical protein